MAKSGSSGLTPVSGDEEISMDTFKLWCSEQGLKPATIASLVDQDFDSIRAVSVLQEEDLGDFEIPSKAQVRLLLAAVDTAKSRVRGGTENAINPRSIPCT